MAQEGTHTKSSKQEDDRYAELLLQEKAGLIFNLVRQLPFVAVINGIPVFKYTADFAYVEGDKKIIEEFKPYAFARHDYQLRIRVCSAIYPELIFRTRDVRKTVRDYKAGKCVYSYRKPNKKKPRK